MKELRTFPYWTVGRIIRQLEEDTKQLDEPLKISRSTFYRLEREGLFMSGRTVGKWRRYTPMEAKLIIHIIKQNYGLDGE